MDAYVFFYCDFDNTLEVQAAFSMIEACRCDACGWTPSTLPATYQKRVRAENEHGWEEGGIKPSFKGCFQRSQL